MTMLLFKIADTWHANRTENIYEQIDKYIGIQYKFQISRFFELLFSELQGYYDIVF